MLLLLGLLLGGLAELSAAGLNDFQWALSAGGAGSDMGRAVAVDRAGNVYLAGQFSETVKFGEKTLSSRGGADVFLAKYSPAGKLVWAASAGGATNDYPYGLAVDRLGNAYVVGSFSRDATFGGALFYSRGYSDIFLAKYDAAGRPVWARQGGGIGWDEGRAVAVDGVGNVYVAGSAGLASDVDRTVTFGDITFNVARANTSLLVKYDAEGNVLWARQANASASSSVGNGVAADSEGHVWIAGYASGAVFLAQYDPLGKELWVRTAPGAVWSEQAGLAVDGAGNAYLTGRFEQTATFGTRSLYTRGGQDVFVAKYDSAGGLVWVNQEGGHDDDAGTGVALDPAGNVYVSGSFRPTATVGNITLTMRGIAGAFVAKYDSAGHFLGVRQGGPDELNVVAAYPHGVAVDRAGNAYVTGEYTGAAFFGASQLPYNWTGDMFLAKIGGSSGNVLVAVEAPPAGGVSVTNAAQLAIELVSAIPDALLFYTLDGSLPTPASTLYTGAFVLTDTAVLRVVAFNPADFSSLDSGPVPIRFLRFLQLDTNQGAGGAIELDPPGGVYASGTEVSLRAVPDVGWVFLRWQGEVGGTNPAVTLAMNEAKAAYAAFGTTLAFNVVGQGTVVANPAAVEASYGSVVRLRARPAPGYYFALWGNAGRGVANPLDFIVTNANPLIGALFLPLAANQGTLDVTEDGAGQVTRVPGSNVYANGQRVTLTAQPGAGQAFLGWSGGGENPLVVTINGARTLAASFTRRLALSAPLTGLSLPGTARLVLAGEPGQSCQVQASGDCVRWSPFAVAPLGAGEVQFLDFGLNTHRQRFFRALVVGP